MRRRAMERGMVASLFWRSCTNVDMGTLVGDIICPRYSSWVLLAAGAVGTLTGTPVEFNGHFISMELMLSSQSSCQAFLLVLHVCPRSMHSALVAQRSCTLLPDVLCRNRRGALLVPLSAARHSHWG
jgi:hypothetical protein